MIVNSSALFKIAKENNYAIPATNFIDSLTAKVYTETAESLGLPLILAYAQSHQDYLDLEEAAWIGHYYANKAKVPIVLHLDHGTDLDFIKKAINLGFNSVMFDGSSLNYDENVRLTKQVVDYAHGCGVTVEGEIGHVGSNAVSYEGESNDDSHYTEVEDAYNFIQATHVDALAVSIGTAHGQYVGEPKINFERLHDIVEKVDVPLVLHGGSSSGDANLKRCAKEGMQKINIFTDLIVAAHKEAQKDSLHYMALRENMKNGLKQVLVNYYHVFETKPVKWEV
ncbi:fructose-bisphosphate aldolase [Halolactibacillus alkaliphilus]|uniref:Fructose-bisphosphate aldolase n=1 Tax=Halolactibacillus alkaliphilus TaxID=442899 RepID=A0A511WZJ6_9BACI|nr:class II fructose-bisphosphate aldolase [Halolactibacillus alkaliphilus]GEN56122.1 fructose-bisphosphate aldolase [Halolactibacillus alkaliphilus]GGN67072.1 fructose-bisphosphate aldolase [Halolactibacillus alkaliphilus]SFO71654.1 fructose-bisphosphate aldolase, class II [Halolactibacillus alkaliphilus]